MKVVFEEDSDIQSFRNISKVDFENNSKFSLTSMLLNRFPKIFSTQQSAEKFLLVIAIICFAFIFLNIKSLLSPEQPVPIPPNVVKIK